jgi:glycerophosphoryl diester phosphodiesterase
VADQVAVVAHRGASGSFPENTAPAFREAIRLGVETIEFDVHLTGDGRGVIIHDPTVDRTSNGSGRVADMSLAEIKALDAGSWFGPGFAGERFLDLGEALDLMPPEMRLNVHVKAYPRDRDQIVPLVVRELVRRGRLASTFVASDQESVALARRVESRLAICNLSTQPAASYVRRSQGIECLILQPGNAMTTPALVAEAHRCGMEVNPFYADEESEMLRLIECGVDGMLTNHPARLQELRRRRGA